MAEARQSYSPDPALAVGKGFIVMVIWSFVDAQVPEGPSGV
jgi:hypothetical protein